MSMGENHIPAESGDYRLKPPPLRKGHERARVSFLRSATLHA